MNDSEYHSRLTHVFSFFPLVMITSRVVVSRDVAGDFSCNTALGTNAKFIETFDICLDKLRKGICVDISNLCCEIKPVCTVHGTSYDVIT